MVVVEEWEEAEVVVWAWGEALGEEEEMLPIPVMDLGTGRVVVVGMGGLKKILMTVGLVVVTMVEEGTVVGAPCEDMVAMQMITLLGMAQVVGMMGMDMEEGMVAVAMVMGLVGMAPLATDPLAMVHPAMALLAMAATGNIFKT